LSTSSDPLLSSELKTPMIKKTRGFQKVGMAISLLSALTAEFSPI
jgi:hypothetical protein